VTIGGEETGTTPKMLADKPNC